MRSSGEGRRPATDLPDARTQRLCARSAAAAGSTVPRRGRWTPLDDFDGTTTDRSQVDGVHGAFRTRPEPPLGTFAQHALGGQSLTLGRKVGPKNSASSVAVKTVFPLRGRSKVRAQDVRILGVQHCRLDRGIEQQIGVAHEVASSMFGINTAKASRPRRPARPARCYMAARVPGNRP